MREAIEERNSILSLYNTRNYICTLGVCNTLSSITFRCHFYDEQWQYLIWLFNKLHHGFGKVVKVELEKVLLLTKLLFLLELVWIYWSIISLLTNN